MEPIVDPNQHRGDPRAYDRYLRGMDVSMRQKVALTAAHLLGEGHVADMGMGSGTGSHALASLYPRLTVTGVDLDPTMVERARASHRLPNLAFRTGDIARPVFEPGSLACIFDSSVLHHVTSFGGYACDAALRALEAQVPQLSAGGVLIVRDFLDPGPGDVLLDVSAADGDSSCDPRSCSTAALLERFSKEFRSLHEAPGFPLQPCDGAVELPAGWRRYRLSRRHAVEFLLRKDYRADWEKEVQEEYTYLTQEGFETAFQRLGLRVLASTPIRNPWILRHRFQGHFQWWTPEGRPLEAPATNYLIAGERVPAGEGVRFEAAGPHPPLGFLSLEHHRHRATGKVFDLVRRPFRTLDVVPFFEEGGELYVLARMAYPRPILLTAPTLDGSRSGGYVTEPLNVLQTDRPLGQTLEEALRSDAGIEPGRIRKVLEGTTYYPSPGGILEEVTSALVEVEPVFEGKPLAARSGFNTSGRAGAIAALQVLRAAQVGGLPDARLELNVYNLLHQQHRNPGSWIGEELDLQPCLEAPSPSEFPGLDWDSGRTFQQVAPSHGAAFLEIRCTEFQELSAEGAVVARQPLEFVVPRPFSTNTLAVAALLRHREQVLLGIAREDLPAAQAFRGSSNLLVAPAWRLPRDVDSLTPARAWVRERLEREYGVRTGRVWELGGRYHPTPGLTPEVVYPTAFEVVKAGEAMNPLLWIPLPDLLERVDTLRDGHLRILCHRAAHALGMLGG